MRRPTFYSILLIRSNQWNTIKVITTMQVQPVIIRASRSQFSAARISNALQLEIIVNFLPSGALPMLPKNKERWERSKVCSDGLMSTTLKSFLFRNRKPVLVGSIQKQKNFRERRRDVCVQV